MRGRILIVEDNTLQSNSLVGLLAAHGFDIDTAGDGASAVAKVRTGYFDVVVIDIPEVDGLALARVIAGLPTPDLRPSLIALAASARHLRDREAEGEPVFDAVEERPVQAPLLLAAIQRCRAAAAAQRDASSGAAASAKAEAADGPAAAGQKKKSRVLVVDDDRQLCMILKSALEFSEFHVTVANDGADAIRLAEDNNFDAVILDYQMPGMTGATAAQSILRSIRRANPARLVAFTGSPKRLKEEDGDAAALFDVIVGKSDGIPALLAAIRQSVDYREWRSSMYQSGA